MSLGSITLYKKAMMCHFELETLCKHHEQSDSYRRISCVQCGLINQMLTAILVSWIGFSNKFFCNIITQIVSPFFV